MAEAYDLTLDALEWVDATAPVSLAAGVADQLWWNYWASGDPRARDQLTALARARPELETTAVWRLHAGLDALYAGSAELAAMPDESEIAAAPARNLLRLTNLLDQARRTHGFLTSALADADIAVPDAISGAGELGPEFKLRQLQAVAGWRRGDLESAKRRVEDWWLRLNETRESGGRLAQRCVHAYALGCFWHHLCDLSAYASTMSASARNLRGLLSQDFLEALGLPGPADGDLGDALPDHARGTAESAYLSSLRIADRLGLVPLGMEIRFALASLLQRHTPAEQRTKTPPWWERWDAFQTTCVDAERQLGRYHLAPEVHRLRFEFFRELAHEFCLQDAYNLLDTMKRARYPRKVQLMWHVEIQQYFNNYGDSDEDHRRSADLFEEWARSLSLLPEAAPFHRSPVLAHEQADALHYAAQARRLVNDLPGALALLDDADALVRGSALPAAAPATEVRKVRNLEFSLRLQRAWVFDKMPGQEAAYRRQIRELWRELQREDEDRVVLLRTLVAVEEKEGTLEDPWPPVAGAPILEDPDNASLSVPAAWFAGPGATPVSTRLEFRLWQLLSFLGDAEPEPILRLAAEHRWFGLGKSFGDTALQLAATASGHRLADRTLEMLHALLRAVRFYFEEVEEVDQNELEALRLLMLHTKEAGYRAEYVGVLYESKKLLERELRVRAEAAGEPDWLWVARRLQDYFAVLVDQNLVQQALALRLAAAGGSLRDFLAAQAVRAEKTCRAREAYERGELVASRAEAHPLLLVGEPPWVFLEDLEALDLWLKCERRLPNAPTAEAQRRVAQLRSLYGQYVRQLSAAIREETMQRMALELVPPRPGDTSPPTG